MRTIGIIFIAFLLIGGTGSWIANGYGYNPKQPDCASIQLKYDSVRIKLIDANFKINRVKYYLKIVNKKPSQMKYLKGWVTRAVE